MIFNIYSYLFFSALAAGGAIAVLMRTIINRDRRRIWDVTSIPFIVLLIISVVLLFAGLFIVDSEQVKLKECALFFLIFALVYAIAFYFLKAAVFPISLFLILGISFTYFYSLKEFSPLNENYDFSLKILKHNGDLFSIEVEDFDDSIRFEELSGKQLVPIFSVIRFPEVLFFLESSSFIKFEGFLSEMEQGLIGSINLKRPFSRIYLYSLKPLETSIYSSLKLHLNRNGSIEFSNE